MAHEEQEDIEKKNPPDNIQLVIMYVGSICKMNHFLAIKCIYRIAIYANESFFLAISYIRKIAIYANGSFLGH